MQILFQLDNFPIFLLMIVKYMQEKEMMKVFKFHCLMNIESFGMSWATLDYYRKMPVLQNYSENSI